MFGDLKQELGFDLNKYSLTCIFFSWLLTMALFLWLCQDPRGTSLEYRIMELTTFLILKTIMKTIEGMFLLHIKLVNLIFGFILWSQVLNKISFFSPNKLSLLFHGIVYYFTFANKKKNCIVNFIRVWFIHILSLLTL